ncbi:MAG: primosomal protein N' [Candidatus Obscuribacterales bacterium]|nr:primosomal protein N' [Steroidobacteraceae bacterium]
MSSVSSFVEVALDTPLRRLFDYRVPTNIDAALLQKGQRVRVPFGRRRLVGVIVQVKSESDVALSKLRSITEVLDDTPIFAPELFGLLTWAADYYRHPIGEVCAAALPIALRGGAALHEQKEQWRLTKLGLLEWQTRLPLRATRLRRLAQALADGAEFATLSTLMPAWRDGLRELVHRGYAAREQIDCTTSASTAAINVRAGHELSEAQQQALQEITTNLGQFRTWLLYGVTGSGKTEVYLRAIEAVVAQGAQALVLVPEIALTPQLIARFQERFATPIAALHSALSDGERLSAWRAARSGAAPIVIGTRSAVFAPLANLGIIVVDEEHDQSYKQQEGFRYSARDLAIVRGQRLKIPVVLGSATPSLESLARSRRQPADLLSLPRRAGHARPPEMKLIDLRKHAHSDGLAAPALQAMQAHLASGGQVLLYLNRRGYAPVLFCNACGWAAVCKRCDARMTVHRADNELVCHHCDYQSAIPTECDDCKAPAKPVGQGTERIESSLARIFPDYAIARIDRDSVRRKGELEAVLARVTNRQVNILVGTQMLTKGHHFPDVSLVVIVNADQGLFGTDFRASERLAQTIIQVAGRAGRAERAGEVLIQTEYPEHPLLVGLLGGGYTAFAELAFKERQHAQWPPFARLALLRAEASTMNVAQAFLQAAKTTAEKQRSASVSVLGPAPAPMARRAGRYRAQLLLRAATHTSLQNLLGPWLQQLESLPQAKRVRWSIDVDPHELF